MTDKNKSVSLGQYGHLARLSRQRYHRSVELALSSRHSIQDVQFSDWIVSRPLANSYLESVNYVRV